MRKGKNTRLGFRTGGESEEEEKEGAGEEKVPLIPARRARRTSKWKKTRRRSIKRRRKMNQPSLKTSHGVTSSHQTPHKTIHNPN